MKKTVKQFLLFFLVGLIFLLTSKPIYAQCAQRNPPCPLNLQEDCSVNGVHYCCYDTGSCISLRQGNSRRVGANTVSLDAPGEFSRLGNITLASLISGLVRLILIVAALVFFFILVIGGIQWIVSGGDKTGVENARKRITNALVGLGIVFVAWAIISLVKVLFGVDIISLIIPSFVNNQ